MPFQRLFRAALCAAAAGFVLAVVGCQPTVREDRTVTFGPDGGAAFQHGHNGVFVTDPKTGKPNRVYEPVPGDLAFSPPAWNPAGTHVVFTVARALDGTGTAPTTDAPADGRRYAGVPIRYTCWRHDPAAGTSEQLFTATANHAGYAGAVNELVYNADGTRLFTVALTFQVERASLIHVWDTVIGRELLTIDVDRGKVSTGGVGRKNLELTDSRLVLGILGVRVFDGTPAPDPK